MGRQGVNKPKTHLPIPCLTLVIISDSVYRSPDQLCGRLHKEALTIALQQLGCISHRNDVGSGAVVMYISDPHWRIIHAYYINAKPGFMQ
jgi:hypothetical protein